MFFVIAFSTIHLFKTFLLLFTKGIKGIKNSCFYTCFVASRNDIMHI